MGQGVAPDLARHALREAEESRTLGVGGLHGEPAGRLDVVLALNDPTHLRHPRLVLLGRLPLEVQQVERLDDALCAVHCLGVVLVHVAQVVLHGVGHVAVHELVATEHQLGHALAVGAPRVGHDRVPVLPDDAEQQAEHAEVAEPEQAEVADHAQGLHPAHPKVRKGDDDRDHHDEEIEAVEGVAEVCLLLEDEAIGDGLGQRLEHEDPKEDVVDHVEGNVHALRVVAQRREGEDRREEDHAHHDAVEARVLHEVHARLAESILRPEHEQGAVLGHVLDDHLLLKVAQAVLEHAVRRAHQALEERHHGDHEHDEEHHEGEDDDHDAHDAQHVVLGIREHVHVEDVSGEQDEQVGEVRHLVHKVEECVVEGLGVVGVEHACEHHRDCEEALLQGVIEDDLDQDDGELLDKVEHLVVVVHELVVLVEEAEHDTEVEQPLEVLRVGIALGDGLAVCADAPHVLVGVAGAVLEEHEGDKEQHADGVHDERPHGQREEVGVRVGVAELVALDRRLRVEEPHAVHLLTVEVLEGVLGEGEVAPAHGEEHAREHLEPQLEHTLAEDLLGVHIRVGLAVDREVDVREADEDVEDEDGDPEHDEEVENNELGVVVPPVDRTLGLRKLDVEVEEGECEEPPRDLGGPVELKEAERRVDLRVGDADVECAEAALELRELDAREEDEDERQEAHGENRLGLLGTLGARAGVAVEAVHAAVAALTAVAAVAAGAVAHAAGGGHLVSRARSHARLGRDAREHAGAIVGLDPEAVVVLGDPLADLVASDLAGIALEALLVVKLPPALAATAVCEQHRRAVAEHLRRAVARDAGAGGGAIEVLRAGEAHGGAGLGRIGARGAVEAIQLVELAGLVPLARGALVAHIAVHLVAGGATDKDRRRDRLGHAGVAVDGIPQEVEGATLLGVGLEEDGTGGVDLRHGARELGARRPRRGGRISPVHRSARGLVEAVRERRGLVHVVCEGDELQAAGLVARGHLHAVHLAALANQVHAPADRVRAATQHLGAVDDVDEGLELGGEDRQDLHPIGGGVLRSEIGSVEHRRQARSRDQLLVHEGAVHAQGKAFAAQGSARGHRRVVDGRHLDKDRGHLRREAVGIDRAVLDDVNAGPELAGGVDEARRLALGRVAREDDGSKHGLLRDLEGEMEGRLLVGGVEGHGD
mmetsp:Transcript_6812/g.23758  ORF Transcript_6812/g.23758 Transcript_6812/m.23758 type:complete len:1163 (-) Transcript_6812:17763-21251(-)